MVFMGMFGHPVIDMVETICRCGAKVWIHRDELPYYCSPGCMMEVMNVSIINRGSSPESPGMPDTSGDGELPALPN